MISVFQSESGNDGEGWELQSEKTEAEWEKEISDLLLAEEAGNK